MDNRKTGSLCSIRDGNDMMVVQFVVLFLARAIFRETSTDMDVKTVNVIVKNKSTKVFHGLFSYRPKLYSETTRPVQWGWFLLFSCSGGHKTKETYPTRPGSPTPCKQGLIFPSKPLSSFLFFSGIGELLRHHPYCFPSQSQTSFGISGGRPIHHLRN